MTVRLTAGLVLISDTQADIWQGQYQLVERVPGLPKTWVIEYLPDPPETATRIRQFWAGKRERGEMTTPVWDKEWSQCRPGEAPRQIGWTSYEDEADQEIARRAAQAGTRTTVRFLRRSQYAAYF